MKTAIKSLVGLYAAVGIITLLIQLYWRYPVCSEAMGCGLSFAKGVKLKRNYNLSAPKGVRGRNSDNVLIKQVLGWAPSISLRDGLEMTYRWIFDQVKARAEGRSFIAAYE